MKINKCLKRWMGVGVPGFSLALLVLTFTILLGTQSYAAIPQTLTYQGKLVSSEGQPLTGSYDMTFKIYASSGGSDMMWTETQSGVPVSKGRFNVTLGSGTPIPTAVFTAEARWLGIAVGGDSEMTPRMQLTSIGYAFRASDADTVGGLTTLELGGGGMSTADADAKYVKILGDTMSGNLTIEGYNLYVNGNARFGSGSAPVIISGNSDGSQDFQIQPYPNADLSADQMGLVFRFSEEGARDMQFNWYGLSGDPNGRHWVFRDGGEGGGAIRMLINTYTGDVGIGTNTPEAKLHVVGNISSEGGIYYGDGSGLTNLNVASASYATLAGLASSAATADYAGLAGSASSAATALTADYAGLAGSASSAATADYATLAGTASVAANAGISTAEADDRYVNIDGDTMSGPLTVNATISAGYKTLIADTANERVGINRVTPMSRLHITDNIDNAPIAPIILHRGSVTDWNPDDVRASSIFHYHSTDGDVNDKLAFAVAGDGGSSSAPNQYSQIKAVINANGNVGIGTAEPIAKLHVVGNISSEGGIFYGDGSGLYNISASSADYAILAGSATTAATADYATLAGTASSAANGGMSTADADARYVNVPGDTMTGNLRINASLEVGPNTASGSNAVAFGDTCQASGSNSLAVGSHSIASGAGSVAMGNYSTADQSGAVAFGTQAESHNNHSVAMGYKAYAGAYGSVSLGRLTSAEGGNGVAIGYKSTAWGYQGNHDHTSVAIGRFSDAGLYGGNEGYVFGESSSAGGYDVAIGHNNFAGLYGGNYSYVFGHNNTAKSNSFIIGSNLSAESNTMAIGYGEPTTVSQAYTLAIVGVNVGIQTVAPTATLEVNGDIKAWGFEGDGSKLTNISATYAAYAASADYATLAGSASSAATALTADYAGLAGSASSAATALIADYAGLAGSASSAATADYATLAGTASVAANAGISTAEADDRYVNVVGDAMTGILTIESSSATNELALDINTSGNSWRDEYTAATIRGKLAVGFGLYGNAIASGDESIAIGNDAQATGQNAIALGEYVTAEGENSLATGQLSLASGIASMVMGSQSTASGSYSMAGGYMTKATNTAAVALGQQTSAGGQYSLAAGFQNSAGGESSFVMGSYSSAEANYSTAIGYRAHTTQIGAIALGQDVLASNYNATAIGINSSATGASSVAIGNHADALDSNTFAFGNNVTAEKSGSMVLGSNSAIKNNGYGSFALGNNNTINNSGSFALGYGISIEGSGSVGIGISGGDKTPITQSGVMAILGGRVGIATTEPTSDLTVFGTIETKGVGGVKFPDGTTQITAAGAGGMSTADADARYVELAGDTMTGNLHINASLEVGPPSGGSDPTVASGTYSVAFGAASTASGNNSFASGYGSKAQGDSSAALGYESSASESRSIAFGAASKALSGEAVALGWASIAAGKGSVAIGHGGTATGADGVAIGNGASAEGHQSVAIGTAATASGQHSLALGVGTNSLGQDSTAMGNSTYATGTQSTAMGVGTSAEGQASTAMGTESTASGAQSIAMGLKATASGPQSLAAGFLTVASSQAAVALGRNTTASGLNSMSIGTSLEVSGDYSVGIGLDEVQRTVATPNTFIIVGGSVGIGTTEPGSILTTAGTMETTLGGYKFPDGTIQTTAATMGNYVLRSGDTMNGNLTIEGTNSLSVGGNVGIGTADPNAKLELYGSDGSNTLEFLRLNNIDAAGKGSKITFYQGVDQVGEISNFHNGEYWSMRLGSFTNTELLTLTQNGAVGIGTVGPKNKLDVEGGAVIGASYSGTETAPSDGMLVEGVVSIGTFEVPGYAGTPYKLNVVGQNTSARFAWKSPSEPENTYYRSAGKFDTGAISAQLAYAYSPPAPGAHHWAGYFTDGTSNVYLARDGYAGYFSDGYLVSMGNVGIGTAGISSLLTVNGTIEIAGGSGGGLKFNDGTIQYTAADTTGMLTQEAADARYVNIDGDTMTGNLTVGATIQTTAGDVIVDHGSLGGALYFQSDAHGLQRQDATNNVQMFTTGGSLLFAANGPSTNHMEITQGGNVGIGVAGPARTLMVSGDADGSDPVVSVTANGAGDFVRGFRMLSPGMTAGNELMVSVGQSDSSKNMGQFYFSYAGDQSDDNRISVGLHSQDDVLNIMGNGRVGIGTVAPATKLHVEGNTAIVQSSFEVVENLKLVNSEKAWTAGAGSSINFYKGDGSTDISHNMAGISGGNDISDGNQGYLSFGVRSGDTSLDEKMRITGSGIDFKSSAINLSSALSISGSSDAVVEVLRLSNREQTWNEGAGSKIVFYKGNGGDYFGGSVAEVAGVNPYVDGAHGNLILSTKQSGTMTETMRLDNAGHVGIGTTTPNARLQVQNNAGNDITFPLKLSNPNGGSSAGVGMLFHIEDGPEARPGKGAIGYIGGSAGASWNKGDMVFMQNNADGTGGPTVDDTAMIITNARNVGIGVLTPEAKLHVAGDITAEGNITALGNIYVHGTIEGISPLHMKGDLYLSDGDVYVANGLYVTGLITGDGSGLSNVPATDNTKVAKAGDTMDGNLTIESSANLSVSGKIGVGVTEPQTKMQVDTTILNGSYGSYSNDRVGLLVGEGDRSMNALQISSNYNSETYPNYGLVLVNGSATDNYDVWGITHDGPAKSSGGLSFLYGYNEANIHASFGSPILFLRKDGNVGIGTNNPESYKLYVNGNSYYNGTTGFGGAASFSDEDSGIRFPYSGGYKIQLARSGAGTGVGIGVDTGVVMYGDGSNSYLRWKGSNGYGGGDVFWANDTDGWFNGRVRVDGGGNYWSNTNPQLYIGSNNAYGLSADAGKLYFFSDDGNFGWRADGESSDKMTLSSAGKLSSSTALFGTGAIYGSGFASTSEVQLSGVVPSIAFHYPGSTVAHIRLEKDGEGNTFRFKADNPGADGYAGINVEGPAYLASTSGNVGIGTNAPTAKLHVTGNISTEADMYVLGNLYIHGTIEGLSPVRIKGGAIFDGPVTYITSEANPTGGMTVTGSLTVDSNTLVVNSATHKVGIGTTTPSGTFTVVGGISVESKPGDNYNYIYGGTTFYSATGHNMTLNKINIQPAVDNQVNIGALATRFATIHARQFYGVSYLNEGADVAEKYLMDTNAEPGDVVVIDKDRKMKLCQKEADPKVAGVVSTDPGVVMNSKLENGVTIALLGCVPTKVDATQYPIEPGDFITTSATPGYGMKAVNPKQGTIIGKALEALPGGQGKILVLISLQ